jgi:hypothetical protein
MRNAVRILIFSLCAAFLSPTPSQAVDQPGLVPAFANWVPQPGGYTVTIFNYDSSFQWTFTPASGQYYFDGQHQITVTGAIGGFPSTLTITTSRPGYTTQTIKITGNVIGLPWNFTPNFQLISQTASSYSVQITNFDPSVGWNWTATAGELNGSNTGVLSVSNLKRGQSSTITVTANKIGYLPAVATYTQTSQPPPLNLIPTMGQISANSSTATIPVSNFDSYFDWSVSTSTGSASIDKNSGVVTVAGLTPAQVAKVTVTDSHSGQIVGQTTFLAYLSPAALTVKPVFDTPVAGLRGFQVQISNFNPIFNWSANSSFGNASIDSNGLLTVTNMQPGQSANVNVTSMIQGATPSTNSITVATWPAQGLNLQVQEPRQTADGFNFQISDFNKFYEYQGTTTAGQLSISAGGLGVVTGLPAGQRAHVTLAVGKNGQVINSFEFDSAAVLEVVIAPAPEPVAPSPASSSISKSLPVKKPMTSQTKGTTKIQNVAPAKPVITIICLKGAAHKFVTATTPKCPAGFTQQK